MTNHSRPSWRIGANILSGLAAVVSVALMLPQRAAAAEPRLQIVGGQDASTPYPFMVSLQHPEYGNFCGATLFARRWVISAGHCAAGIEPGTTLARIGSADRTTGGSKVGISRVVVHPNYTRTKAEPDGELVITNDLVLVELDQEVTQPPAEVAGAAPPTGHTLRTLGWGVTCSTPEGHSCGAPLPVVLQELDMVRVPDAGCRSVTPSRELCVDSTVPHAGACKQDSGGPLVHKGPRGWVLDGVTSRHGDRNLMCGSGTGRGIWTDISAYRDWIAQVATSPEAPADDVQPLRRS